MTIDYDEELLQVLELSPEQFQEEARMFIAVKLYELGHLSTGAAAQFALVPKPVFLTRLADYGVATFNMSPKELEQDVIVAQRNL